MKTRFLTTRNQDLPHIPSRRLIMIKKTRILITRNQELPHIPLQHLITTKKSRILTTRKPDQPHIPLQHLIIIKKTRNITTKNKDLPHNPSRRLIIFKETKILITSVVMTEKQKLIFPLLETENFIRHLNLDLILLHRLILELKFLPRIKNRKLLNYYIFQMNQKNHTLEKSLYPSQSRHLTLFLKRNTYTNYLKELPKLTRSRFQRTSQKILWKQKLIVLNNCLES